MSRRRAPRRNTHRERFERPVVMLGGATAFNTDPADLDPVELVRELKRFPQFLAPLRAHAAELAHEDGRARRPGDWTLLYLAYVFSGETALQKFLRKWRSSAVWEEAGFQGWRPDYNTVWLRFDELEKSDAFEAFRAAGDLCVRQARRHDERVGRDAAVDATAFEAHARLRHCCPDRNACRALRAGPQALRRADASEIADERHERVRSAINDDAQAERRSGLTPVSADDPRLALLDAAGRLDPHARYYDQRGHLFRCVDGTAGGRKYRDKTFWLGGLLHAAVDVITGAPLAVRAYAADEHEYRHYPALLDQVKQATGQLPDRVAGDRGLSRPEVFRHNTSLGVASVFPWRKLNRTETERRDLDTDSVDRHGIPRCRHCGGPGDLTAPRLGFHLTGRAEPVLVFRCMLGLTAGCAGDQQITCTENPRLLLPLSRLTPEYHAMSVAGKHLERVWGHWRRRYGLAGKNPETRVYRRHSVPCQQLRADAARFIEWFRVLLRLGWVAGRAARAETDERAIRGDRRLNNVLRARSRHRLAVPYGAYAHAAGLAPDPSPPPTDRGQPPPGHAPDPETT
jgi:hypothetical protein